MEKINIAKILKDCPQRTKLYSPICGECTLVSINNSKYAITVRSDKDQILRYFSADGRYTSVVDAECLLFPSKDQRDWSKFHRPFNDGDIIYTKHKLGTEFVSIFQVEYERDICTYWDINLSTNELIGSLHDGNAFKIFIEKDKVKEIRLATEEEKQKLFNVIKARGYYWNDETKTLKNLIQPIFKAGNKIRSKNKKDEYFYILNVDKDRNKYILNIKGYCLEFKDQDNFELVPNKFDITTLKPYNKVLVRDKSFQRWDITFYELYDDTNQGYPYRTLGGNTFKYCIPYKGNEHLTGLVKDCDEYYKTWEK